MKRRFRWFIRKNFLETLFVSSNLTIYTVLQLVGNKISELLPYEANQISRLVIYKLSELFPWMDFSIGLAKDFLKTFPVSWLVMTLVFSLVFKVMSTAFKVFVHVVTLAIGLYLISNYLYLHELFSF